MKSKRSRKDRETRCNEQRFHIYTEVWNPPIGSDIYGKIAMRKCNKTCVIMSIGDVRKSFIL